MGALEISLGDSNDDEPPSLASNGGSSAARKLSIGKVLGDAFSVLFANIAPFFLIALVLNGIAVVIALVVTGGGGSVSFSSGTDAITVPSELGVRVAIAVIVSLLAFLITQAAVTFGVVEGLRGRRARIGACVRQSMARAMTVVGASLLALAIVFATALLLARLGSFTNPVAGGILAFVAIVMLVTALWVVVPVAVAERLGVFGTLERSFSLTRHNRLRILGVLALLFVIVTVVSGILGPLAEAPSNAADGGLLGTIVGFVLQTFWGLAFAVFPAVTYVHLRNAKEGAGIDEITAVFE